MKRFYPDVYKESIFTINYDKLKSLGIKVLLFDMDNTLIEKERIMPDEKTISLLNKLKSDFDIVIISNTNKLVKINNFNKMCDIKYVMKARKPFKYGYKKVKRIENVHPKEICMIGDQLITDMWGAKRMGYYTVLVTPIGNDDHPFTSVFRMIEKFLYKRLKKKFQFEKGTYYE